MLLRLISRDQKERVQCLHPIVWLVAKKGVDATDIQLLSAIVAVATVALLVGIGWVGYILGLFLGYVGIKIEKLAHVIAEKSSDNEGEYE